MRVLVVAYMLDRNDVGETLTAFKLLEQMSKNCEMTILAFDREGKVPLQEQLPNVRVVTWKEPVWLTKKERINAMLKPAMPVLSRHVRRWAKER
jgi:nucleoid-associated protein YejK